MHRGGGESLEERLPCPSPLARTHTHTHTHTHTSPQIHFCPILHPHALPPASPPHSLLSGATVTDRVYLDLGIGRAPAGRLVIGVHGNSVPRASLNFVELGEGGAAAW